MPAPPRRPRWPRIALAAASVLLTLGAVELALRIVAPPRFHVWRPGLRVVFTPDPKVLPGVTGTSTFEINARGMRAGPPPPGDVYGILTVGGSTTECLFLDQDEAWPSLLEQHLGAGKQSVFVGNVGKSGHAARDHVLQVRHLLPQHPDVRALVLLVGINDLQRRLERDVLPSGEYGQSDYERAFMVFPAELSAPPGTPFHERTRLFALLRAIDAPPPPPPDLVQDASGHFYARHRARRASAPHLDRLPELSSALDSFRAELESIVDLAAARSVRVVLMTQPALWRQGLGRSSEALLWFGWNANGQYYRTDALAAGMVRYNAVTKDVCARRGVSCVDLASRLPRSSSMFYDDCHFNEQGARAVAAVLAEHFFSEGPLSDPALAAKAREEAQREAVESDEDVMQRGLDVLHGGGPPEEAVEIFRALIARTPTHYGAHYQLAVALGKAGRAHEARPVWQTVLRMAETYRDAETAARARTELGAP